LSSGIDPGSALRRGIHALTLPEENRQNAITVAVVPGVGFLWWVLVLRRRLAAGIAGPTTTAESGNTRAPGPGVMTRRAYWVAVELLAARSAKRLASVANPAVPA
jgi:hypothetical protein